MEFHHFTRIPSCSDKQFGEHQCQELATLATCAKNSRKEFMAWPRMRLLMKTRTTSGGWGCMTCLFVYEGARTCWTSAVIDYKLTNRRLSGQCCGNLQSALFVALTI